MSFKKWRFFTWTRDNHAAFAEAVAEELNSKATIEEMKNKMSKSGDKMVGALTIHLPPTQAGVEQPLTFKTQYRENSTQYTWSIGISAIGPQFYIMHNGRLVVGLSEGLGFFPMHYPMPLGYKDRPWSNTFTKKLNNGADIEIPNKAGTLALVSDIEDILRKHGLIPNEPQQTEQPTEQQG